MNAEDIRAGRHYINAFGAVYIVDRIDGGFVVYRVKGTWVTCRIDLETFATLMTRDAPDE